MAGSMNLLPIGRLNVRGIVDDETREVDDVNDEGEIGIQGEAGENDEEETGDDGEDSRNDENDPWVVENEIDERIPEIYIKAVNPGYTIDGVSNVGEMIEIGRRSSDAPISLADLTIGYTNSSGNSVVIAEFPENSRMVGETILLRLASSPMSELATLTYAKTLAFRAGPLEIRRGEEVIDSVCWNSKEGCASEFKSANPTTLVRDLKTNEFNHVAGYEPVYDEGSYLVEAVGGMGAEGDNGEGESKTEGRCKGLVFSEILSYYESSQSEQFIEFYNSEAEQILLDGCQIRYKNKLYPLSGIVRPEEYFVRFLNDFSLTKNPTSSNKLELVDEDGTILDKLEYPNGQKKGTAYAMVGHDGNGEAIWRVTYAITPGEANNYQEFKVCEAGKVINEATGNCVKVVEIEEKVCGEGEYLNLLTGRCKKIEVEKTVSCKEGYYLNEETGRCRKIVENDGANYSLVTETYEEESSFIALWVVLAIIGFGIIYAIYEFRKEILGLFRKVYRRFH